MKAQEKSADISTNFLSAKFNNLKARNHKKKPKNFSDDSSHRSINSGIYHKGNKFITHTDLHHKHSAIQTFHLHQKIIIILLGGAS
ncbi:hypothetical protein J7J13_03425 [bacterium]|nr:hypothetical protein [bacterium]